MTFSRHLWLPDNAGAGLTLIGSTPAPPQPPTDYGYDIRDWLTQPGDQILTVPAPRTLVGGSVWAPHPATNGPLKGWLALVAEAKGQCIIDQSPPGTIVSGGRTANGDLIFLNADARVAMIGFKFIKGSLKTATYPTSSVNNGFFRYLYLWGCEGTFHYTEWVAENPSNAAARYHDAPRLIDPRYGTQYVEVYATDLHDTATAFFPRAGVQYMKIVGNDIYNLDDGGSSADPNDIVHPDGVGMVGGQYSFFDITDNYIHPGAGSRWNTGLIIEDPGGQAHDITLARMWIAHSGPYGGGLNLHSQRSGPSGGLFGTANDLYVWDNGFFDLVSNVDGVMDNYNINWSPSRIYFPGSGVHIGSAPPAGAIDPATAWRTLHPYESWQDFFGPKWAT